MKPYLLLGPLLLLGLLAGCSTSSGSCWQLRWRIREQERFVRSGAEILTLPRRLEGEETWWACPGLLLVQTAGSLRGGESGGQLTVLALRQGWVVEQPESGDEPRAWPLPHWFEERVRAARGRHLAAHEARERARAGSPGSVVEVERFLGSLAVERHRTVQGDPWASIAATPGQLWNVAGRCREPVPWQRLPLALALPGVTRDRESELARILAELQPRRIEEVSLPTGERTLVLARQLEDSRAIHGPPAGLEERVELLLERVVARERERSRSAELWGWWLDPASRPADLDRPGLRARLAEHAALEELPELDARIVATDDPREREELLLLLESLDQGLFDRWLALALEEDDAALLIPMVLVVSLRRPVPEASALLERLATPDRHWQDLDRAGRQEVAAWLAALTDWHREQARDLAAPAVSRK